MVQPFENNAFTAVKTLTHKGRDTPVLTVQPNSTINYSHSLKTFDLIKKKKDKLI